MVLNSSFIFQRLCCEMRVLSNYISPNNISFVNTLYTMYSVTLFALYTSCTYLEDILDKTCLYMKVTLQGINEAFIFHGCNVIFETVYYNNLICLYLNHIHPK